MKRGWYLVFGIVIIIFPSPNLSLAAAGWGDWFLSVPSASPYASKISSTGEADTTVSMPTTTDTPDTIDEVIYSTSEKDVFETTKKRDKKYSNLYETSEETSWNEIYSVTKDPLASFRDIPHQGRINGGHIFSLHVDKIGAHRLLGIHNLQMPFCDSPVAINLIDFQNVTYALCVSKGGHYTPAAITMNILKPAGWEQRRIELGLTLPKGVASFVYDDKLFFIVADHSKAKGNELVEYDPITDTTPIHKHTVNSRYATAVTIWRMDPSNEYYLAIANSAGESATEFKDNTSIYKWSGTYFDSVSTIITYDVRDIEPFRIGSHSYLAVANYRYAINKWVVDSEIFKLDWDTLKWTSFQQIRTYAATDWEFFTFGEEHGREYFLVVANELDQDENGFIAKSVVYKFVNGKFSLFQCLETVGASHISTFQGDKGEFLLAISNRKDALNLYQYDGWHFILTEIQYTNGMMGAGIVSLATHYVNNGERRAILAVANTEEGSGIFELEFEYENRRDEWHKKSIEWCNKMKDIASLYDTDKMVKFFGDFYFVDQEDAIVTSDLSLKDLFGNRILTSRVEEESGQSYEYNLKLDIENKFSEIHAKISLIEQLLERALLLDTTQIVTGNYFFDAIEFECKKSHRCVVHSIEADTLNGIQISNLHDEVIFTDESQNVEMPLEVSEITANDISITGTINGLKTSNLVTLNGNHTITATKYFQDIETPFVSVTGTVDGIRIKQENILLTKGSQTVTGNLTYQILTTYDLDVGLLNGVNIDKFYKEIVLKDGSNIIKAKKRFDVVEIDNLSMNKAALFNNINLAELWDNVLWKHTDQDIFLSGTFGPVTIKDVQAERTINGVSIPKDVLLTNQDIEIDSVKTFTDVTSISELHIRNSINRIKAVPQSSGISRLDILLKSKEQNITGIKTFKNIHLENNSSIKGLINEINIGNFYNDLINYRRQQINGSITFYNVTLLNVFNRQLEVLKENLNKYLNDSLKLTDTFLDAIFIFKGDVNMKHLNCAHLNGLEVPKDFVLQGENRNISGRKIFKHLEIQADAIVEGLVNGVQLSFLDDVLRVKGDQFIAGHKDVRGSLYVNSLTIDGLINGISMDDVILTSSTITNLLIFESMKFESNLRVQNLIVKGVLNGINLSELLKSLTYSGSQIVTGIKTISGQLTIVNGGNLNTSCINGLDLSAEYKDAVLLKRYQEINGTKIFETNVTFHGLIFKDNFDGVTDWDMRYNWMRQGVCHTVTGSLIFKKGVNFRRKLEIGSLNGEDIVELNSTIIRTNETSIIGDFVFEKVVTFDIELNGKINGIYTTDFVLKAEKSISITSNKNFVGGFKVHGNIDLTGLINGVSTEAFCNAVLKYDDKIEKLTIVGSATFQSNLTVAGLLNGWNLSELYQDGWFNNIVNTNFDSLVLEGPALVEGLVSEVDIVKLNDTYLSQTRNQSVYGLFVFQDKVTISGNLQTGNMYVKGKIDGIDVGHLVVSILKTTGDQTVTSRLSFETEISVHDIIVYGKVNQLKFPEDIILKNRHGDIHINGTKIFTSDILVNKDLSLDIGATIQGVDVSEWEKHAIFVDSTDNVVGIKTFSYLTVNDIWITGLLDNLILSDCPTSIRIKSVTDVRRLSGNISVKSLQVEGLINGMSLDQLAETTMKRNEVTILSTVIFTSPIYASNLRVNGSINDFDLDEFYREFKETSETMTRHDLTIHTLQETIDNQAVILLYYEEIQVFHEQRPHLIIGAMIQNTPKLIVSNIPSCENCSYISLYDWNYQSQSFLKSYEDPVLTSGAVDIEITSYGGEIFMAVANLNEQECSKYKSGKSPEAAQILIWNTTSSKFNHFQNLIMNPSIDVEAFIVENKLCLAFSQVFEAMSIQIYCINSKKTRFDLKQIIDTKTPSKVSVVHYGNSTYLAVANSFVQKKYNFECNAEVYRWNKIAKMFILYQTLHNGHATIVLFVPYITKDEKNLFLVVGEETISDRQYVPPLTIYSYYEGHFMPYQKIGVSAIISVDYLILNSNKDLMLYVLTGDKSENLKVYRHQGASKFALQHTLTFEDGKSINAFQPSSGDHYLVLARKIEESCLPKVDRDRITGILLKSKMKGNRSYELKCSKDA